MVSANEYKHKHGNFIIKYTGKKTVLVSIQHSVGNKLK